MSMTLGTVHVLNFEEPLYGEPQEAAERKARGWFAKWLREEDERVSGQCFS
jgi:hypothetical protein